MNYSAEELEKFLDHLATKGLMPKPTVVARKGACSKMLSILDDSEKSDVREIDLDELTSRFINLNGTDYTPDSLKTYKSRVSKSIEDFIRYKLDPLGFKVKQPAAKKTNAKQSTETLQAQPTTTTSLPPSPPTPDTQAAATTNQPSGLTLPIPIRQDLVIQVIGLPYDLKQVEAQKIANVILAMAASNEF
ncbi:MAG: hypothetical protein HWE35_22285 [Rhodobacteraceae bacterium]|nr:hypothetical protein [Paracoccaceae bacterium]